ncbi:DUF6186 family protein [Streptomyces hainanensis]|uniref:Uncharacterized protein n=1 Tax=Streptomyces hainanensis TaxID=402648 RepID=A0A4R4TLM4_9ACTN|nr:DUF6186 family protein [Streptomyces hainanensis]TDC74969.1 hypothetical protein E1283_13895 [Streptomyces hainanensis]
MRDLPFRARIGYLVWVLLFTGLFTWEAIGLVNPTDAYPTLSQAVRALSEHQVGRWGLFVVWLWLGLHAFVRHWRFLLRGSAD